jgi:hypothetical protein
MPFSMTGLSQIEKRLGSFSNDSASYIKDSFLTLTSDEKERVWLAAQAHADDVHNTDLTLPVGSTAVPHEDPHWDSQDPAMLAT